tara:strand:- start:298 stop:498 length:201 start_codon:yes stop_codon:yes gene_type:complete
MSRDMTKEEILEWVECYIDHLKDDPIFAENFIDWLDGLLFDDVPYGVPSKEMVKRAIFPHLPEADE